MSNIDYDVAVFLTKWTSQEQPEQFTAALRELVEKVEAHGFRLGTKASGDMVRAALDKADSIPRRGRE